LNSSRPKRAASGPGARSTTGERHEQREPALELELR
jgi:hypothetical protein